LAGDAPAWHAFNSGRWRALAPAAGSVGFTLVPPSDSGVTFTNHLAEASAADNRVLENGSGIAIADVDGDGDLDLYVATYRTDTFRDDPPRLRVEAVRQPDGTITVTPEGRFVAVAPRGGGVETPERCERDVLYLNQGGGKFAPVSWTSGAFLDEDGQPLREIPSDWGLAAQFRGVTGDGLPDLYVCNDFAHSCRVSQMAGVSPRGIFVSNEERATTWDAKRAAVLQVVPRKSRGSVVRPSQTAAGRLRPYASPQGFLGATQRQRLMRHDTSPRWTGTRGRPWRGWWRSFPRRGRPG
jgi:hypothetical protein